MSAAISLRRNWFAPEVVQTSAMDCGPAALKCLLEGFGIRASYGRLREACQTGLDGTSIDTIEAVANRLGIAAEQVMLPPDQLFLGGSATLPALAVMQLPAGPAHFVLVWRQAGHWLQVMDPATGRRWVRREDFLEELFRHELSVPAADWRDWAAGDEYRDAMTQRLAALGVGQRAAADFIATALADANWYSAAVLDAAVRLVASLCGSGAVKHGDAAERLLGTIFTATCAAPDDIYTLIPRDYWTVHPDPQSRALGERRVLLSGAVLLRINGRRAASCAAAEHDEVLTPELAAALTERREHPAMALWRMLRADGVIGPAAVMAATLLAVAVAFFEALAMRGMIEIGQALNTGLERLAAASALLLFMGVMLCFRLPIASQSMRMGRQLETRLRMAILARLPQLPDRYLQSRPISDMADRAHSLHMLRLLPGLALHVLQLGGEIVLTVFGLFLIDQTVGLWAAGLAIVAVAVPALCQALVSEADLRARSHAASLNGVTLDALMGHVPIRVHAAQPAVKAQHEALLADWSRAMRRLLGLSMNATALQQLLCQGLAGFILVSHFARAGGVAGSDLLLVYWLLKLPAAGQALVALAQQYPAQHNVVARLLEPLSAPEQKDEPLKPPAPRGRQTPIRLLRRAAHVAIENGTVLASGHAILSSLSLTIEAGEHVAIVGPSGAGKSSLMGLLLGWHRLAEGRLTVDGRPLTAERLVALRRETAWVDPGIQLWNSSLLDNLTYSAEDQGLERLMPAIEAAELRKLLKRLPQGLQSALGEGGALVSGGEGQRVRFARALMQQGVRLALLDEPFRGLARGQRASLMAEARAHWRDATLVCITHDIEETLGFDRVIVIEDGRVAESGAPRDLATGGTRYAALLAAEAEARDTLWQAAAWDRLRLENGHVIRIA